MILCLYEVSFSSEISEMYNFVIVTVDSSRLALLISQALVLVEATYLHDLRSDSKLAHWDLTLSMRLDCKSES